MAEFADVFDPNGDPQGAMVGMMRVSFGMGGYELRRLARRRFDPTAHIASYEGPSPLFLSLRVPSTFPSLRLGLRAYENVSIPTS